jgi:hypothetical protein
VVPAKGSSLFVDGDEDVVLAAVSARASGLWMVWMGCRLTGSREGAVGRGREGVV